MDRKFRSNKGKRQENLMKLTREYGLAFLLAGISAVAVAQPFEQRGPTGDNRAATGNPGTQEPPTGNGKEAARKKQPRQEERREAARKIRNPDAAAPTAAPGTPAENNAQPESAK